MAKIIDLMHYVRVASGTGFAFVLFGMGGLILNGVILLIGWIPVPSPETKAWVMQKVVHSLIQLTCISGQKILNHNQFNLKYVQ